MIDPVVNLKFKQRIRFWGACATLGMDYLTDLAQWRLHCMIEDAFIGGTAFLATVEIS